MKSQLLLDQPHPAVKLALCTWHADICCLLAEVAEVLCTDRVCGAPHNMPMAWCYMASEGEGFLSRRTFGPAIRTGVQLSTRGLLSSAAASQSQSCICVSIGALLILQYTARQTTLCAL